VFYVYFLENKDKNSYVGCTNDLKDRLERHNKGYVEATKDKRPWKLVAYFAFSEEKGREFIKRHIKWNEIV